MEVKLLNEFSESNWQDLGVTRDLGENQRMFFSEQKIIIGVLSLVLISYMSFVHEPQLPYS